MLGRTAGTDHGPDEVGEPRELVRKLKLTFADLGDLSLMVRDHVRAEGWTNASQVGPTGSPPRSPDHGHAARRTICMSC